MSRLGVQKTTDAGACAAPVCSRHEHACKNALLGACHKAARPYLDASKRLPAWRHTHDRQPGSPACMMHGQGRGRMRPPGTRSSSDQLLDPLLTQRARAADRLARGSQPTCRADARGALSHAANSCSRLLQLSVPAGAKGEARGTGGVSQWAKPRMSKAMSFEGLCVRNPAGLGAS